MLTELRQELSRVARSLRKGKGPVIIVEDDQDDQLLLWREVKFLLGDAQVQTFGNGAQLMAYLDKHRKAGEKAFRQERPRLILLDIHMPKMDGLETLGKLKKAGDMADVPVVVISGTRSDDDIMAARSTGAQAFLSKPFSRGDWVFF